MGSWVHLGTYIVVNAGVLVQWWVVTGGTGFPWTTLGWGMGIVAHFFGVRGQGQSESSSQDVAGESWRLGTAMATHYARAWLSSATSERPTYGA